MLLTVESMLCATQKIRSEEEGKPEISLPTEIEVKQGGNWLGRIRLETPLSRLAERVLPSLELPGNEIYQQSCIVMAIRPCISDTGEQTCLQLGLCCSLRVDLQSAGFGSYRDQVCLGSAECRE